MEADCKSSTSAKNGQVSTHPKCDWHALYEGKSRDSLYVPKLQDRRNMEADREDTTSTIDRRGHLPLPVANNATSNSLSLVDGQNSNNKTRPNRNTPGPCLLKDKGT